MEEDEAIEWVQARTFGFLLFPFLILCQLSKAFEEKNLLVGAGIRGAYILRSLSKKGRQQLTLHLYVLLSPVQGEEWATNIVFLLAIGSFRFPPHSFIFD